MGIVTTIINLSFLIVLLYSSGISGESKVFEGVPCGSCQRKCERENLEHDKCQTAGRYSTIRGAISDVLGPTTWCICKAPICSTDRCYTEETKAECSYIAAGEPTCNKRDGTCSCTCIPERCERICKSRGAEKGTCDTRTSLVNCNCDYAVSKCDARTEKKICYKKSFYLKCKKYFGKPTCTRDRNKLRTYCDCDCDAEKCKQYCQNVVKRKTGECVRHKDSFKGKGQLCICK